MQLELALIGLFQAIVVAIIAGLFARDSSKRDKAHKEAEAKQIQALNKAEVRAVLRAEESLLAIKLMSASVNLGIKTAVAIRDGNSNGGMNEALEMAAQTEQAYQEFIKSIAAKQIAESKV